MILTLAIAAILIGAEPTSIPKPLPISAHNCYPANNRSDARLAQALALGIDNIEIDLGWDAAGGRLIVGHDAAPREGRIYPELAEYVIPALERHRKAGRPDNAPTVLTIDWKTTEPEAVRNFKAFLDDHADWFSSAPKVAGSALVPRRLTVCLTGDDRAKEAYDALIPPGGTYRAFRDKVFGAGAYFDNLDDYAPRPADTYFRFLTFHWATIERGAPAAAGDWTPAEAARLKTLMTLVHNRGYRARFYCLNGSRSLGTILYAFPTPDAARARWHAAADAGVDFIATDDYAEIVAELRGERGPD